jgi:hypothetical protein
MTSSWTLRRAFVALAALGFAVLAFAALALANSTAARAETEHGLPADPSAAGYIGLCNESGQNVIGGSIDARPFIWKAVSSTQPPAAYQGQGQNADLVMYQPRPDTAPAYWSGTAMTAASYYTSEKAPAVQATYADLSLHDMINEYPPQVDGLYVLRMHYGKADYGLYNTTYPVAVIQVTGKSWHLVQGGTVKCAAAKATSNEQLTGAAGARQFTAHAPNRSQLTVSSHEARAITASTRTLKGTPASTHATGSASGPVAGTRSTTTVAPGTAGASSSDGSTTTRSADRSNTSGTSWVVWLLVGIVVVLAAALAVTFRTRRPTVPGPDD